MSIIRKIFGYTCSMCHKTIQKGNYASFMYGKGHLCIDCIIKPESNWGNIRTREKYFEYVGKPDSREEWNIKLEKLGYPSMSRLKWFIYHGLD